MYFFYFLSALFPDLVLRNFVYFYSTSQLAKYIFSSSTYHTYIHAHNSVNVIS